MSRPLRLAASAALLLAAPAALASEESGETSVVPAQAPVAAPAVTPAGAPAPAADAPTTPFYAVLMGGTTLGYRPAGASTLGPQKDFTPGVGAGVVLKDVFFLELDVTRTYVSGAFGPTTLVPGLSYAFHPNFFAAARLALPVQRHPPLTVMGGLGALYSLTPRLTPMLEVDVLATPHGTDAPDLALGASLGLIISL